MHVRSNNLPRFSSAAFVAMLCVFISGLAHAADPLPSWNDGAAKTAIVDFVHAVTDEGGAGFVPPEERIAVFDNDGTLWSEKPVYFQLLFAIDRVKALAPEHPEWKTTQPFQAVLENDMEALAKSGEHGLLELMMASHAGMTTAEFEAIVTEWISTAKHPQLKRPYTDLVFQPMLEVLDYLRANGFKTYIVSGGGIEFMRPWTGKIYGIPPEQVVGSSIKTKFEIRDGEPVLVRLPEIDFIDDKAGKPVGIYKFIGRRPIAAFGNSDGDFQMLEWTAAGAGPRLMAIVHHTDEGREWAYDRKSHVGRLDRALDEAGPRGWVVVDMKNDWRFVYPFEMQRERRRVKMNEERLLGGRYGDNLVRLTRRCPMKSLVCALTVAAAMCITAGGVAGQSARDRYLDYSGLPDQLSGGSRMIPVDTPKGTFHVWVKRIGNNPDTKVLLLHGGPGMTHEYLEALDSYLPGAGIEYYYYDQLGSFLSDQPNEPDLWELPRSSEA